MIGIKGREKWVRLTAATAMLGTGVVVQRCARPLGSSSSAFGEVRSVR